MYVVIFTLRFYSIQRVKFKKLKRFRKNFVLFDKKIEKKRGQSIVIFKKNNHAENAEYAEEKEKIGSEP